MANILASKLVDKRKKPYSTSISFVRRKISFDLIRTCVISFRGDRGAKKELAIEELDYGLQDMEVYQILCLRSRTFEM